MRERSGSPSRELFLASAKEETVKLQVQDNKPYKDPQGHSGQLNPYRQENLTTRLMDLKGETLWYLKGTIEINYFSKFLIRNFIILFQKTNRAGENRVGEHNGFLVVSEFEKGPDFVVVSGDLVSAAWWRSSRCDRAMVVTW